jgi:hypothetical protein
MTFSKIDKKVLIVLILVIVIILLIGFAIYKYTTDSKIKVQDFTGEAQTEQKSADNTNNKDNPAVTIPQIQIQANGVQAQGGERGGLSVCVDECGDGVCQKADLSCDENNNLNCICPENPQECPKDCK